MNSTTKIKNKILNNIKIFNMINILVSLLIGFLVFTYFPVTLSLELKTDTTGLTNISYSSDGFVEDGHSVYFNSKVSSNFETYTTRIPLRSVSEIRISPISVPGNFQIKSFSYRLFQKETILSQEELLTSITPLNDIIPENEEATVCYEGKVLAGDAYLEIVSSGFIETLEKSYERYLISIFCTIVTFILGLLSFKGLKKGLINKKTLYITNLIISLIILSTPPDGISYIKTFLGIILVYVIPGYLLLNILNSLKKRMYIHTKFVLSLVVGFSLWFISLYITSQLGIPIPSLLIYIIVGICLILFLYTLYKKNHSKKIEEILYITNTDLGMFFLFNILLFVYIVPLKGLLVAPLHDPAAISIQAKLLLDSRYVLNDLPKSYLFYPPAGFFLTALPSDILNITTSKTTMIITNIFNILSGFAFATMMKKIFKGKYLAIISVIIFSFISLYPSSEYFRAGKNAQVIAFFFLFVSLYFFYNAIDKDIKSKSLFGITFFSSVLIHYNNLLITGIFCIVIYLYKTFKQKKLSYKLILKDVLNWIPIFILILCLFYLQLNIIKNVEYSSSNILPSGEIMLNIKSFLNLENFYNWIVKYKYFRVPQNIIDFGLVSYLFLIGKFILELFKNKKINHKILFVILLLIGFYVARSLPIDSLKRYLFINKFLIYILPITISINYVFQKKLKSPIFQKNNLKVAAINVVIIVFLLIISFKNMQQLFKQFNNVRIYSVVQDSDLKAFDWINTNLPPKSRFLPANIRGLHRSNYTLLYDSSLYMKAFTNSYELFTFVYGNELPNESELAEEYLLLIEDPTNKDILKKFTSSGVYYIFSGSVTPWGCGDVPCNLFNQYPKTYNVIYDKEGVKIYEIINR